MNARAVRRAARLLANAVPAGLSAVALLACHSPLAAHPAAVPSAAPGSGGGSAGRYVIDAQRSELLVLVYRDGPMGHLGHNHVISLRQLSGSIALADDPVNSSFAIEFPVEAMTVDEPQLRAREGSDFDSTLDEAAVAGTRDHMLGEALLNSVVYPTIHLQSQQLRQAADGMHVQTAVTVRTATAQVDVPVGSWHADDRQVTVNGEFDLTHSQLGLAPYSVALGALRVADRMHVQYRLVANRD